MFNFKEPILMMIKIKFKVKYSKVNCSNRVIICSFLIVFAAQICFCDSSELEKNLEFVIF